MASIILLIIIALFALSFFKEKIIKSKSGYCYVISRNAKFHKCLIGDNRIHFINPTTDIVLQTIDMNGHELDMYEMPIIMKDNIILKLKCDVFFQIIDSERLVNCNNYPSACIEIAITEAFRAWANNIKADEVLMDFSMYPDKSGQYLDLWQEINEKTNQFGVQVVHINCHFS